MTRHTALLIQGHQNDLLHESGKLWSSGLGQHLRDRNVITHLEQLVAHMRENDALVVHGLFINDGRLPANAPLFQGISRAGGVLKDSWGARCLDTLEPVADDVVLHKSRESAFVGTILDLTLRRQGVRRLVLAGATTSMGVETAARAAADLGYDVVVAVDACADPVPDAHDASVTYTLPVLAEIATTSALLTR